MRLVFSCPIAYSKGTKDEGPKKDLPRRDQKQPPGKGNIGQKTTHFLR